MTRPTPRTTNLDKQLPLQTQEGLWTQVRDADPAARDLFLRHYSARHYQDGRHLRPRRTKFIGPGEYIVLLTPPADALFVWRKFIDRSGQQGINCSVFRNESPHLSSLLILEAEQYAWARWGPARLYTYVNPRKIRSTNPGACFKKANWQTCGHSKSGLVILEKWGPQNPPQPASKKLHKALRGLVLSAACRGGFLPISEHL